MAMFKVMATAGRGKTLVKLEALPIDYAGEEPESLLPDPKDGSVKLNMQQAEELLLESVREDVQTFMAQWQRSIASGDASYPAELSEDEWYQQFYAWMGV